MRQPEIDKNQEDTLVTLVFRNFKPGDRLKIYRADGFNQNYNLIESNWSDPVFTQVVPVGSNYKYTAQFTNSESTEVFDTSTEIFDTSQEYFYKESPGPKGSSSY